MSASIIIAVYLMDTNQTHNRKNKFPLSPDTRVVGNHEENVQDGDKSHRNHKCITDGYLQYV